MSPRHRRDRSHIALVTSREELIYLLSRASELEHGLACVWPGHRLIDRVRVPGVEPWNHENPRRYRVTIVLRDDDGTVVDVRADGSSTRRKRDMVASTDPWSTRVALSTARRRLHGGSTGGPVDGGG